jgi:hypothetical protein
MDDVVESDELAGLVDACQEWQRRTFERFGEVLADREGHYDDNDDYHDFPADATPRERSAHAHLRRATMAFVKWECLLDDDEAFRFTALEAIPAEGREAAREQIRTEAVAGLRAVLRDLNFAYFEIENYEDATPLGREPLARVEATVSRSLDGAFANVRLVGLRAASASLRPSRRLLRQRPRRRRRLRSNAMRRGPPSGDDDRPRRRRPQLSGALR